MTQSPLNLPGVVLAGISSEILQPDMCRQVILQHFHQGGAVCPECAAPILTERAVASFWSGARVCCKGCGKWFDARTGTVLAGTTLGFQEVYLLALLLASGRPVRQIADRLQLHEGTVRDWRDRLTLGSLGSVTTIPIGEGTAPRRGEGERDGSNN